VYKRLSEQVEEDVILYLEEADSTSQWIMKNYVNHLLTFTMTLLLECKLREDQIIALLKEVSRIY
jgi:hypothetical protein